MDGQRLKQKNGLVLDLVPGYYSVELKVGSADTAKSPGLELMM